MLSCLFPQLLLLLHTPLCLLKAFANIVKNSEHLISACSKLEAKRKRFGYSNSTKSHIVTCALTVASATKSTASRDNSPRFSLQDIQALLQQIQPTSGTSSSMLSVTPDTSTWYFDSA